MEALFFGEMCCSVCCLDVYKPRGIEALIFRQHRPFMSIKSFEQMHQVRRVTKYGVPMLAYLFELACANQNSFVLTWTLGARATAGGC